MEKEQLKEWAERLKWYVANLKIAESEMDKNVAIGSILGYLEVSIEIMTK